MGTFDSLPPPAPPEAVPAGELRRRPGQGAVGRPLGLGWSFPGRGSLLVADGLVAYPVQVHVVAVAAPAGRAGAVRRRMAGGRRARVLGRGRRRPVPGRRRLGAGAPEADGAGGGFSGLPAPGRRCAHAPIEWLPPDDLAGRPVPAQAVLARSPSVDVETNAGPLRTVVAWLDAGLDEVWGEVDGAVLREAGLASPGPLAALVGPAS